MTSVVRAFEYRRPTSGPIFAEVPEDIDETWRHGFMIGGMACLTDPVDFARLYLEAGDTLVEQAESGGEAWRIAYPALFMYRHAIEIYLKAIVRPTKRTHNLVSLAQRFVGHAYGFHHEAVPVWFQEHLMEFATMDPDSTAFRYADAYSTKQGLGTREAWVELAHLRDVVHELAAGFDSILHDRCRLP